MGYLPTSAKAERVRFWAQEHLPQMAYSLSTLSNWGVEDPSWAVYDDCGPGKLGQSRCLRELYPKNNWSFSRPPHYPNGLCIYTSTILASSKSMDISTLDKIGIVSFPKYIIPLCTVNTISYTLIDSDVYCWFSLLRLSTHQLNLALLRSDTTNNYSSFHQCLQMRQRSSRI